MDFKRNQPIYMQIADVICENILVEKWREGDRIPSVREQAVSVEVNPNTVMRTYSYLQDKGIIFNQRGIGFFISEDAYETIRQMKRDDFIKTQLPAFFKNMKILGITSEEIVKEFEKYENQ